MISTEKHYLSELYYHQNYETCFNWIWKDGKGN